MEDKVLLEIWGYSLDRGEGEGYVEQSKAKNKEEKLEWTPPTPQPGPLFPLPPPALPEPHQKPDPASLLYRGLFAIAKTRAENRVFLAQNFTYNNYNYWI